MKQEQFEYAFNPSYLYIWGGEKWPTCVVDYLVYDDRTYIEYVAFPPEVLVTLNDKFAIDLLHEIKNCINERETKEDTFMDSLAKIGIVPKG